MNVTTKALTPANIERGLTHPDVFVQLGFAERTDYTPTPKQIERGLTSEHLKVRRAFAKRKDYTPSTTQIERGLIDDDHHVRYVFVERADLLSIKQIERGLLDFDKGVRRAVALRLEKENHLLPPSLVYLGLADTHNAVRELFELHQHEWLSKWEAHALKLRHASVITKYKPSVATL